MDKKPPIFIEFTKGQLLKTELVNSFDLKITVDQKTLINFRSLEAEKILLKMIEEGFV